MVRMISMRVHVFMDLGLYLVGSVTKAVTKTNLGRRLLMLTCMKPRLLRLQKLTNESAWGVGVKQGAAGPGLTSTSPV